MAKLIVEFLKTHGRYVKGDVAGFDAATIAKWPQGVCKPYDPDASKAVEALSVDTTAAEQLIADARAELETKGGELDARDADLKAREEALAAREAALTAEAENTPPALEAKTEKPASALPKEGAGTPPKQGAKT